MRPFVFLCKPSEGFGASVFAGFANLAGRAKSLIAASFVAFALMVGGGGSPTPLAELILQMGFVVAGLCWVWVGNAGPHKDILRVGRTPLLLAVLVLLVPVLQLIPLPSSVWTSLPGRETEAMALRLVGAGGTWRPISQAPAQTLASTLAMIPPLFVLLMVASLGLPGRRHVLGAVVLVAFASALFGAAQLAAGAPSLRLYPGNQGAWITGFQANRNAQADLLLIASVFLAAYARPLFTVPPAGHRRRTPRHPAPLGWLLLAGGLLLLITGAMLTGSRTGVALLPVALGAITLILFPVLPGRRLTSALSAGIVALGFAVAVALAISGNGAQLSRLAARFGGGMTSRIEIWSDAWFALGQYWPVGFGVGTFPSAMLPWERLEFVAVAWPNRAHNDFLELGVEAGLLGYVVLLASAALILAMAICSWRQDPEMRPYVVAAIGSLLILGLHSAIDYPLRSMSIACLGGVAAGLLAPREKNRKDHRGLPRWAMRDSV